MFRSHSILLLVLLFVIRGFGLLKNIDEMFPLRRGELLVPTCKEGTGELTVLTTLPDLLIMVTVSMIGIVTVEY